MKVGSRTGIRWGTLVLGLAFVLVVGCGPGGDAPEMAPEGEVAPMGAERAPVGDAVARALLDSTIAAHGGAVLERARMGFVFRGTPFTLTRDGGAFVYERARTDSAGRTLRDILGNDGLRRDADGDAVPLAGLEAARAETAVNSVAYFALLPVPLADPAVVPHYLGPDTLRGAPYERVEVTFRQTGGGRDWQDRYVYWLHADDYTMDYLAYSYELAEDADGPNDTGHRFREAINARSVGGVRVQDYRNYTADSIAALEDYADLLGTDQLRLVSEVVLDSVTVEPLG